MGKPHLYLINLGSHGVRYHMTTGRTTDGSRYKGAVGFKTEYFGLNLGEMRIVSGGEDLTLVKFRVSPPDLDGSLVRSGCLVDKVPLEAYETTVKYCVCLPHSLSHCLPSVFIDLNEHILPDISAFIYCVFIYRIYILLLTFFILSWLFSSAA